MYAVVVRERRQAHQINISGQHVQGNVLPRAVQAPGFVSGLWMTDMASNGQSGPSTIVRPSLDYLKRRGTESEREAEAAPELSVEHGACVRTSTLAAGRNRSLRPS